MLLLRRLVPFQGELEELVRGNILSLLVKIFSRERYVTVMDLPFVTALFYHPV